MYNNRVDGSTCQAAMFPCSREVSTSSKRLGSTVVVTASAERAVTVGEGPTQLPRLFRLSR